MTAPRLSRAMNFLIVEDDRTIARACNLAVTKALVVAQKGADALELAKQYQPSAVSLDVFLPTCCRGCSQLGRTH
jgi:DNA-binding response OmpR family regulator